VSTLVGGISLIASSSSVLSAVIIASSSRKNWSPNPSMLGFVPYQFGLASKSAMSFFSYFVMTNGPPPTSGLPSSGTFANVLIALPSPVAYCDHTCSGRIGVSPRSKNAVPDGWS
jgi:hypothetical protein